VENREGLRKEIIVIHRLEMGLGGRWIEMDLWNCERERDYCEERM